LKWSRQKSTTFAQGTNVESSVTVLLYPFMLLAALGFILSVAAHLTALAGLEIPGGEDVWALHMGIFVVWIPTVLVSMRATRNSSRRDSWKVVLSGCPPWMRTALYVLLGYALLNFFLFVYRGASHIPGNHLSDEVRGFSGHWMIFYAAAFATLYSAIHSPNLFRERKCPKGHPVSATAKFCPECGLPVAGEGSRT
jgi:hypothetical protein